MQIFLRSLSGTSVAVDVELADTVSHLQKRVQPQHGLDVNYFLTFEGKVLSDPTETVEKLGMKAGSTVCQSFRLRGGKPVKVKVIPSSPPGGQEVQIDIEKDTPMFKVKMLLQDATGIPVAHQKVMLAGIGQMVVGDKRTNIGFSHCGTANNLYLATLQQGPEAKSPELPK